MAPTSQDIMIEMLLNSVIICVALFFGFKLLRFGLKILSVYLFNRRD